MLPSFVKAAGELNVSEVPPVTGAEDFSYFAEKVPSLFFFIGGKQPGVDPTKVFPHHTPDFWIDERGMKTGIKAFCHMVFDYENAQSATPASSQKKPF
jgi:amidohydrolase